MTYKPTERENIERLPSENAFLGARDENAWIMWSGMRSSCMVSGSAYVVNFNHGQPHRVIPFLKMGRYMHLDTILLLVIGQE